MEKLIAEPEWKFRVNEKQKLHLKGVISGGGGIILWFLAKLCFLRNKYL